MLGQYVLAKEEWRTDDASGTWVKVPWWSVYFGPGIGLVSIFVAFVSIYAALLLWLLLPLRDLLVLGRVSPPGSPSINNHSLIIELIYWCPSTCWDDWRAASVKGTYI